MCTMKHTAISTAILSTTLTACADPIVGEWVGKTATSSDDESSSISLPYESCISLYYYDDATGEETPYENCSTISFDLAVESDLTGTMDMYGGVYTDLPAEITKNSGSYKIDVTYDYGSFSLDCNLSDATNMSCDFDEVGISVDFEKK